LSGNVARETIIMWHFESPDIDDPSVWAAPNRSQLSGSLVPRLDGLLRTLAAGGPRSAAPELKPRSAAPELKPRSAPELKPRSAAPELKPRSDQEAHPSDQEAPASPREAEGAVARHLFAAADPSIAALLCGSATAALRDLSRRSARLDERTRIEIAGDDPASCPSSFQALCDVVGVGLVVRDRGVATVVSLLDTNVWLERGVEGAEGGAEGAGWRAAPWSPASKADAANRVRRLALEAASKPETSMRALRKTAADVGMPRPFPRSKAGLGAAVRAHLAS
jgi:hypothetical protein